MYSPRGGVLNPVRLPCANAGWEWDMSISYDKSSAPRDLRLYDDNDIAKMANAAKEGSREAAIWGEVLRLRRVVKRLVAGQKEK